MARAHRRFGPLFYPTATVALILIASIPFWQSSMDQLSAWRLTRELYNPVEAVRRGAAEGLVQLGSASTPWVIRAMRDPDARVRALACSTLVRTVPEDVDAALDALLAAIKDSDPTVRAAAVKQLELIITRYGSTNHSRLREKAGRAIGSLLTDAAPEVRGAIRSSLYSLGPLASSAVVDLKHALDGPDKRLRVLAAELLMRIDPTATRANVVAALSALLTDQSLRLEHWILVKTLTNAQGEDATAALLIPLLEHPDLATRIQAINDLITHCPQAKAFKPALIKVLAFDDAGAREEAGLFLLAHDPSMTERAIDTIAKILTGPFERSDLDWDLINRIRQASPASLTPLARTLVDKLARAENPVVRVNAIRALGAIGPEAKPAVPALLDASKCGDLNIATSAVAALAKIDPPSAATRLTGLLDWMKTGQDVTIRRTAMASLRDIGPAAASAIPALLHVADEDDLRMSSAAIEAISKIDPATGSALKQAIEMRAVRSTSRDDP